MNPPWKFAYSARNPVKNNPEDFKKAIANSIEESGDKPIFIQVNISPPHRSLDKHMTAFPEFLPDQDHIITPEYLADTPAMREDLAKYNGSVQLADACAGRIIDVLKEKELLENTLVIFTSDRGEPYHRAKTSPYHAGLHVPFVASGPMVE